MDNLTQKHVEFWFDFGSPASYLAWFQLPKTAASRGAAIDWRPMLLGGVFQATSNRSPVEIPSKGKWMHGDLPRWAGRYGAPYKRNPHFPINTLTLMRGAVGLQMREPGKFLNYVDAIYRAMWDEALDLGNPTLFAETLAKAGFEVMEFTAMVSDPAVKQKLIANTEEAVQRGVFGAPTIFVGEQMFFGQDRLEFVKEALAS